MDHRSTDSLTLVMTTTAEWSAQRLALHQWVGERAGSQHADDVLLACGEGVDNAFEHGRGPVTIVVTSDSAGLLDIVIRDHGSWRVSAQVPARGLGLPIMTALMENVTIDTTNGTALRLSRRFSVKPEG